MSTLFSTHRGFTRGIITAGVVTMALGFASSAIAGECPADKFKAGVREPVTTPATGVTDTVLATIDLAKEPVKLNDHLQRVRKLVIQPGGVVPWHSHTDRPALIYIIEGEIAEYASNRSMRWLSAPMPSPATAMPIVLAFTAKPMAAGLTP